MTAYDSLLLQIDAFIRKYYKNELIKGSLLVLGVLFFSILLIAILEYFGRFSSPIRATLLLAFVTSNAYIVIRYIVFPFFKLYAFGQRITQEQAAQIIGEFFPEIGDQLTNTLQLKQQLHSQTIQSDLLEASIQQRSSKLSIIPFKEGIDFKKNRIYFKYVLPIIGVFILLCLFFPNVLTQGTKRVVNYQKIYKPEAPFRFVLSSDLQAIDEGEDALISLRMEGNQIPEKIYLVSSEGKYLMESESKISHLYQLQRVKKNITFYFEANGFESRQFILPVTPKAVIGKFNVKLAYPAYLNYKDEVVENAADLSIPQGTKVTWQVGAKNTDNLTFVFGSETKSFAKQSSFLYTKTFMKSDSLRVRFENIFSKKSLDQQYKIDVVPDLSPAIQVSEVSDSVASSIKYFEGQASDDYALTKIDFVYQVKTAKSTRQERINLGKFNTASHSFQFAFDFRTLNVQLGDVVEYYFVVFDNDGINGSKSTRSSLMEFKFPNLEELNDKRGENQEMAKKELASLANKALDFKKSLDRFKKEAMNTKSNEWSKLNQLKQLQQEQLDLQKSIEQIKNKLNESFDEKMQLTEMDKELLDKQKQIEDLLNSIMDKEMLDLLKQLEDALKKQDQQSISKDLEKVNEKSETMNKNLDRTLEALKKMQVNEKVDALENELKELSQEQKDLKKDLDSKRINKEDAQKKQDDINDKFKQVKEDLKELNKLNESLTRPLKLGETESREKQISKSLEDAKSNLEKNKEKQAKSDQEKAAEEMDNLAEQLDQNQQSSNEEQQGEDIALVRSILENLLRLSFDQEALLKRFSQLKVTDPAFVAAGKRQRNLVDNSKQVADSLYELAKRQPMIASFVDQELQAIFSNHSQAIEQIGERKKPYLSSSLQYVMTSYNNLALLLNESLQQMQADMQAQSKQKGGSCDNPNGKGKSPGQSTGDMKEALKKQLDKLKKGEQEGGSKPGSKPGDPSNGMPLLNSQEAAKMAAEQRAIREQLEKMRSEMNKDGKGSGNQLSPLINDLERQEQDLLKKNFTAQFIKRQQEIMTRLLDSEKAMRERGYEDKRESKSVKDFKYSNLSKIDEYNKAKLQQTELLKQVEPSLRKYYRNKANLYFNRSVF